jgi:hypothetical protein
MTNGTHYAQYLKEMRAWAIGTLVDTLGQAGWREVLEEEMHYAWLEEVRRIMPNDTPSAQYLSNSSVQYLKELRGAWANHGTKQLRAREAAVRSPHCAWIDVCGRSLAGPRCCAGRDASLVRFSFRWRRKLL